MAMRLQQGGEALTKKSSFFLFHPYTVMAENPSSFLRQRTTTLPFSPLLGDGREPSSFLRQRTATLPFSPLLGDGREPSSFLRQRTAKLFLLPAENRNFLFHHTPRLQQGGEALTKKSSFFLFHPYTVMAENPPSFLRQRTATLPFSPLLGDGREPSSFLRFDGMTSYYDHFSTPYRWSSVKQTVDPPESGRWINGLHPPDAPHEVWWKFTGGISRINPETINGHGDGES
ncbi:hypothetical protein M5K25_018095 [Dendrobium thyrsiflorum]|uniref:Uncharacterized protein n=1 Tax=Dendrobium thyrsiflorum TaxID=117978 RepID=A0ABD0UP03_DENTH